MNVTIEEFAESLCFGRSSNCDDGHPSGKSRVSRLIGYGQIGGGSCWDARRGSFFFGLAFDGTSPSCPKVAHSRVSGLPKILTTIATVIHNAIAYSPYHITSCPAARRGALKMTREPVELTCTSWANSRLFVLL
jgi:hypothetical protein